VLTLEAHCGFSMTSFLLSKSHHIVMLTDKITHRHIKKSNEWKLQADLPKASVRKGKKKSL